MNPRAIATSVLTLSLSAAAQADTVQPLYGTGPNWPQFSTEFGTGRGVYFSANASFGIQSVEFLAHLFGDESYDLVLFEGGGSQTLPAGDELLTVAFTPPEQPSESWLTIPFVVNLIAGEDYVVLIRQSDGEYTQRQLTVHSDRTNQITDDENLGFVTYHSARSGIQGDDNNRYAPLVHLVIPEPSTLVLLAAVCLGLLTCNRASTLRQ